MQFIKKKLIKVYNQTALGIGIIRAKLPNIKNTWEGEDQSVKTDRHAVYVHFDKDGEIFDYVLHALKALRACGYTITFVTNSPKFPNHSLSAIKPYTRLILHRYNSGYDFAAYRDGIRSIDDLDEAHSLILMNDSVYGPLFKLEDVLKSIDNEEVDVWGVTDSWEFHYHVQSYFMVFFNRAVKSKAFQKFWKEFPNLNNKRLVIQNGEIKLSNKLVRQRLNLQVQCPSREVTDGVRSKLKKARKMSASQAASKAEPQAYERLLESVTVYGRPSNTSHLFWEAAITDWNCLFLKRELIQLNPMNLPDVWRWRQTLEKHADYDVAMIEQHLRSL